MKRLCGVLGTVLLLLGAACSNENSTATAEGMKVANKSAVALPDPVQPIDVGKAAAAKNKHNHKHDENDPNHKHSESEGLNRGDRAGDFEGQLVYGGTGSLALADYVGTYPKTPKDGVIVAFGASWCGFCKLSLATLEELSQAHKNLQIIYVGTDDNEAGWQKEIALFEQKKLSFPLVRVPDPDALMETYFGHKRNVPRFYLIDSTGVVRIKDQGFSKKKMGQLLPKQTKYLLSLAK